MGYDLYNEKGEDFRWNMDTWGKVLQLAERYGWTAQGTQSAQLYEADGSPVYSDEILNSWDGGYCSNDLQTVTAEDSAALADALERALPDIPDMRTAPDAVCYVDETVTSERLEQIRLDHEAMRTKFQGIEFGEHEAKIRKMLGVLMDSTPVTVLRFKDFTMGKEPPTVLIVEEGDDYTPSPIDMFSGERMKAKLAEFIAFCRVGSFSIH